MRQGVHRTVPRAEPLELRRQQRRQSVPAGDDWLHEPKLDGYRLQVVKSGGKIRLFSRRGNDWTSRLPVLAEALTGIPTLHRLAAVLARLPARLKCMTGTVNLASRSHSRN